MPVEFVMIPIVYQMEGHGRKSGPQIVPGTVFLDTAYRVGMFRPLPDLEGVNEVQFVGPHPGYSVQSALTTLSLGSLVQCFGSEPRVVNPPLVTVPTRTPAEG